MTGRGSVRNEISGGIFFSHVIQGRDITIQLPPELTPALAGLRDPSAVFTGRDGDLSTLLALLDPAAAPPGQRTVQLSGLPGVGKTELALHAARTALDRGWFPGGVLFIDMQGYHQDGRLDPGVALASLLRAVGIPDEHVPATAPDRSALFNSVLDAYSGEGRPVLLMVDNALTAAQVTPLIPAAGKVIVTSRHTLPIPNAARVEVNTLTDEAAAELIAAELDLSAGGADPRVAGRPAEARVIARLCDGLPLALHIVAALLAAHRARPLASMADDLRDARGRLDEMRFSGPEGDELAVRSAFDLSYRQLDEDQRRLFRLMALNLGPEISTEAASAVASLQPKQAQRLLLELDRAHLIRTGTDFGRWRMHDLILLYAHQLEAEPDEAPLGFGLLLAFYFDRTLAAGRRLDPTAAERPDDHFADRAQALAWLDAEYPNLTPYGNVVVAEPAFLRTLTADLFLQLWRYFELRHQTEDWIRLTTHALTVARALADRRREADALSKLGGALRQARRFAAAIDACQQAAAIQREVGNRAGEGVADNNLAAAQTEAGRYQDAVASAEAAAAIFRETGDRYREGIALSHLGGALAGLERFADSADAYRQALDLFRQGHDEHGTGGVLTNLGNVLREEGQRLEEALTAQRAALAIMRQSDDRHGTVIALGNLSDTLRESNRIAEAAAITADAVSLARELGDPRLEGFALNCRGLVQRDAGQTDEAVSAFEDAAAAFHSAGDTEGEGIALSNQGAALLAGGRLAATGQAFQAAAAAYGRAGNRGEEANALRNVARVLWAERRFDQAIEPLRAARSAYRDADDPVGEGHSLMLLGAALGYGRIEETLEAYRDAVAAYERAGRGPGGLRATRLLRATESARDLLDARHALLAAGKFEEVLDGYRQVAAAARRSGDTYGQAVMSASLGAALRGAGRFGEAIGVLDESVAIFAAADDPDREQAAREELEAARRGQADAQTAADRLGTLLRTAARGARDGDGALRAALEAAARCLGPHDRRLFRLLSACPGPAVSTEAATLLSLADPDTVRARLDELSGIVVGRKYARLLPRIRYLCGPDTDATTSALAALARMRLVERDRARPDHWRLADLVRPYATEQGLEHAQQDLRDQARALVLIYYFGGTNAASIHLDRSSFSAASWGFADQQQAIAWLDAEYPGLIATVHAAAAEPPAGDPALGPVIVLDMTRALTHITSLRGRADDAITLAAPALRAAADLGDQRAAAVVLRNLGGDLIRADRGDEGIEALQAALDLYREAGDRAGEGTTLTNLGGALIQAERWQEAAETLRAAVARHRELGSAYSEAVALGNLGAAEAMTGRIEEGIADLHAADKIYRKLGDPHGRSTTLGNLGEVLVQADRGREAVRAYRDAAALARAAGDPRLCARLLRRLAVAHRAAGRLAEAEAAEREAAEVAGGGPRR